MWNAQTFVLIFWFLSLLISSLTVSVAWENETEVRNEKYLAAIMYAKKTPNNKFRASMHVWRLGSRDGVFRNQPLPIVR